jgi:hypothetical protein
MGAQSEKQTPRVTAVTAVFGTSVTTTNEPLFEPQEVRETHALNDAEIMVAAGRSGRG